MRAAACAQVALQGKPSAEEEATALFFLAVASSTAAPPELWQLDALYLERCVERRPHTAQARACVSRLVDRLGHASRASAGCRRSTGSAWASCGPSPRRGDDAKGPRGC